MTPQHRNRRRGARNRLGPLPEATWRGPRRISAGRSRPRSLRGGQDGSASVELVIATPLLLLLLLGIVQFAVWEHATHIAQAAAAQGLAAARVQGGGPAAGSRAANTVLAQLGTGVLQTPAVSSQQTANAVQVRVSGHAEAVLPFLHLHVQATAAGPVEAVYPNGAIP